MKEVVAMEIGKTVRTLLRAAGWVLAFFFALDFLIKLADNNLIKVDVIVETIVNISATIYFSYAVGISGTIYGYVEHRLRRKERKRHVKRIKKFESDVWKEKLSSRLTDTGTTNKEDL
ncbi:MAG: hypothetical protein GY936_00030 [Ignavibacteriae bacterium]|nr:hypothetical protein [Ignavibacteriota bacterium]